MIATPPAGDSRGPIDGAPNPTLAGAVSVIGLGSELHFRGQDLSKDEQLAFTRQFGEIEEHVARHSAAARYDLVHAVTNVGDDGQPTTKFSAVGNDHWHTDKSYHAVPSLMTLLHAKELPPEGGDTQFANMAMAYETLPEG